MPKEKCHTTGKRRYATEQDAKNKIVYIRKSLDKREKAPTRYYLCDHCHGFHLSSQEIRAERTANLKHEDKFKRFMDDGEN
jgi:hypothetical protein